MAFSLTLLSIVLCYLSPAEVFPSLAPYHIQQFILVPALASTIPVFVMRGGGLQSPQYLLLIGFWFAVVISLLSRLRLGASFTAFTIFGVTVCIYFLVSMNTFSLPRINIFCRVLTLCALFMAIEGIYSIHTGYLAETLQYREFSEGGLVTSARIRAYGILNDPNDFAQFLLVGLAFLGLSWKRRRLFRNLLLTTVPAAILIYGIYLTGSRGAIFGLVAIAFAGTSRRLGIKKSLVLAVVLFAVLVGGQFGGGRDISIHEGSAAGRVIAWGSGIADLRGNPLFGVGYGQFTEYNDNTAHNSWVLCFAELGFFGYFFWLAMLVTTVLGLETLAKAPTETPEDETFGRYVTPIRAALYSFLATSWFLSRTYHETLYILLALGGVLIYQRRKSLPTISIPLGHWVPLTCVLQIISVVVVYFMIRLRTF